MFRQGKSLITDGRLEEGLAILLKVFERTPSHFNTLRLLGDVYDQLGRSADGKTMWELALLLRPMDERLLRKLNRQAAEALCYYQGTSKPLKCSIIVPIFNQVRLTEQCLAAISDNTPRDSYEVIVVDNGSTDGTGELLQAWKSVKVVRNQENLGFATACNQGADAASHELILFLNNDVEVHPGWLAPLVFTLAVDSDVAVAGSKLLYPDGRIQHAGVVALENQQSGTSPNPLHIYRYCRGNLPEASTPREYLAITAACLLTRKSVFQALVGFDRAYWNGYEDVDYCYKVFCEGYKTVYRPESVATHFESQSGPERFSRELRNYRRLIERWRHKIPPDVKKSADGTIELVRPFKEYEPDSLATREPLQSISVESSTNF